MADWLRFFVVVLAALNVGFLAGLAKAYFRATRSGDQALARPAKTLAYLAVGLLIVFLTVSWRVVQNFGAPANGPLLILPIGYAFTLYGFIRLRTGVRDRVEEYAKRGRHHSNPA